MNIKIKPQPNIVEEYENVQCSYSPVQRVRGDDFHVTKYQVFYNFTNGKQIDTEFSYFLYWYIKRGSK